MINAFNKKQAREIPGEDVVLTGKNFPVPVEDPKTASVQDRKMTGVFVPLGTQTKPGQTIPGETGGIPITDQRFHVRKGPDEFVLTPETHAKLLRGKDRPPQPLVRLPVHSAAQGIAFGRPEFGLRSDQLLIAEMGTIVPAFKPKGDEAGDDPPPDPVPPDVSFQWPGFRVQLVDLSSGRVTDFLRNKSGMPATAAKPDRPETGTGGGLERPIQLEWGPDGALYIVDFGVLTFKQMGNMAHPHTGTIWRMARVGSPNLRSPAKD